jgi:hypothetical protein
VEIVCVVAEKIRRNKMENKQKPVRIKPDLYAWAEQLAKEDDRSVTNMINVLLESALEAQDESQS